MSSLQEILSDIENRAVQSDILAKRILYNITATMSDRASTERIFNALLEEKRSTGEVLYYQNNTKTGMT